MRDVLTQGKRLQQYCIKCSKRRKKMNGFTSYEDWCEYQTSLIKASKNRQTIDVILDPVNIEPGDRHFVYLDENQDETERDYVAMPIVRIESKSDMSHYPDTCYECGHPSYNGNFVDCSNSDCKNWRGNNG